MKTYVIDTSALLRLYLPDGPLADRSEEILELAHRGNALLYAPELILAEAAQVLLKKERSKLIDSKEFTNIQQAILALPIELATHKELIPAANQLARKHHLSIYDALFLALAQKLNCSLLTCDDRLARAK